MPESIGPNRCYRSHQPLYCPERKPDDQRVNRHFGDREKRGDGPCLEQVQLVARKSPLEVLRRADFILDLLAKGSKLLNFAGGEGLPPFGGFRYGYPPRRPPGCA